MGGRQALPPHTVGLGKDLPHDRDAARDRSGSAALVLDGHGLQPGPELEALRLDERGDLVGLAPEAHHDHGGEVRVSGVAADRPPQHVHALALARHGAARLVRESDHPVDVRVVGEGVVVRARSPPERVRDVAGDRGRAVHRRQDADVVARGHLPALAQDALERRGRVGVLRRRRQGGEGVLALELAHRQVLRVHVLAGCDVARGEADHLPVAEHGLAARDRAGGHLVPSRNRLANRRPLARDLRAGSEVRPRDDDAVAGVEAKREREGRGVGGQGRRRA